MKVKITGLILLAFLLILPVLACAADSGSSGSGGTSSRVGSGDLLNLLPKDVSRIQVMAVDEITGGSVPESMTELFEATWNDYSLGGEDEIVTVDDVDQVVRALSPDGGIVMLSGSRIDFAAIGQWLADDDTNIGKTSYQGEEMWGNHRVAMVLMQSEGYLVFGDTDAVKELLKVKARGTGSLAEDSENELKKAYEEAAAGWYVLASSDCDEFSADLRSCEAYSITGSRGQEDYLVNVAYRLTFRSEERAESQALDIEDLLDDRIDGRGWRLDIDEVETGGVSVEARMSGDEEDFTPPWLGINGILSAPPPLPTATPEPESRSSTRATEAPTAAPPTAAPTEAMSPSAQGVLHVDTEAGFEILAPAGWTIEEIKYQGIVAIFNSPDPDDPAHINVGVESAQGMTLEEMSELTKEQMPQLFSDFNLLRDEAVAVGGRDARILEYTVVQGDFHLRQVALFLAVGRQVFSVSGTALRDTWDEHGDAINASLRSFRVR